jgi:6-phosphogluconolactonase
VTNDGSNNVFAYTINATSGALTQVNGSPFGQGTASGDMAVDPTGKFAYVTNLDSYTGVAGVSGYAINAANGALTQVNGSPFQASFGPLGVAVDPTGKFAYVTNIGLGTSGNPGSISAYRVKVVSGALTQVKGSPFAAGTSPFNVAVDPTGKFTYVINLYSNDVSAYRIDARSGALTQVAGSPFATGAYPDGLAIAPTGKFAYVADGDSDSVSAYTINATSGALTQAR